MMDVQNPPKSITKLLELVSEFSKIAWYQQMNKRIVFCLPAMNSQKVKFKKYIIYNGIKKHEHLEINLTKHSNTYTLKIRKYCWKKFFKRCE